MCTSTTTCLSTITTKSVLRACLHVRTFLHCLRPMHVCTCMCEHVYRQPKPYAVSTITWTLAVTTHITCIGMYVHVSISFNPSQHLSCTSFMSMHIYIKVKSSMVTYVHVSICAFLHSTNAWVHVNRQHYAWSKITWMCVHMSALASTPIMCVHVKNNLYG